jgi:FAR1 DNA-binding domain
MKFQTVDEAWSFWMNYGGRNDFEVRKCFGHKSTKYDVIILKVFFCRCEGTRGEDKRDHLTKNPRAETRTSSQVHLQIKFDRGF